MSKSKDYENVQLRGMVFSLTEMLRTKQKEVEKLKEELAEEENYPDW